MSFVLSVVRPSALQNWIAVNAAGSLKQTARESWRAYLTAQGATGNSLNELEAKFISAQAGKTLSEKWLNKETASAGNTVKEKLRNKYK